MCVVVMKEELSWEMFSASQYRDYENLSNQKTLFEYNKVLNG